MPISINQIKSGLTILLDNSVFSIVGYQHVKPGKGSAFVRIKLKNLKTDAVIERTLKSDDKITEAFIDEKKLTYLYRSGDFFHFMDQNTFEESIISKEHLKDAIVFLKDNLEVSAYYYNHKLIKIILPNFIDFKIVHTEPGIKGDTAKSVLKPAQVETGATVQVPLFINEGDIVRVDTRTSQYISRV
ncbi:elongation factor P [Candidatus Omnitrophota bacterium]